MRREYRISLISLIFGVVGVFILGQFMLPNGGISFNNSPLYRFFPDSDAAEALFPLLGMSFQIYGFSISILFLFLGGAENKKENMQEVLRKFDVIVNEKRWLGSESEIVREISRPPPKEKIENGEQDEKLIESVDKLSSKAATLMHVAKIFNSIDRIYFIGFTKKKNWFLIEKSTLLDEQLNLISINIEEAKSCLQKYNKDYLKYFGENIDIS